MVLMSSVIIVHGTLGYPTENWFPWLKEQVEKSGHLASAIQFPTPEGQTLANWRSVFDSHYSQIGRETILVGHSLGVAFIFDILERAEEAVRGSFLVGGFVGAIGISEFDLLNHSFMNRTFDWARIKQNMGRGFIYHGNNDPYVPIGKCYEVAKELDVAPRVIENGGYLNALAGYTKFDVLWRDL